MSRTTLEFTVTVNAEEMTLNNIKRVLTGAEPGQSPLKDVLADMVKKKLTEAGISGNFTVFLNENRVVIKKVTEGGLNPQEWLDKDTFSDIPQFGQELPEKDDFRD